MFVLVLLAISVATGTFLIRRVGIAEDERIGRERFGEQIATQVAQLQLKQRSEQRLRERKSMLARLQDSLARHSKDTSLLLPIGSLMIETGDTLGALTVYKYYIDSVNNTNVVALTDYAFLVYATGNHTLGRQLTEKALRLQPRYQIALYNMAVMDYDRGNVEAALSWLERCRSIDSTSDIGILALRAIEHLQQRSSFSQTTPN